MVRASTTDRGGSRSFSSRAWPCNLCICDANISSKICNSNGGFGSELESNKLVGTCTLCASHSHYQTEAPQPFNPHRMNSSTLDQSQIDIEASPILPSFFLPKRNKIPFTNHNGDTHVVPAWWERQIVNNGDVTWMALESYPKCNWWTFVPRPVFLPVFQEM